jgi:Ca-activated chloride channel family protein
MKFFIAIVLTLFSAFAAFAQAQAEVIVTSTFLRKSPDATSEKVQTVQKGDFLVFEKSKDTDGWYYVSTSNRTIKGWIRKDTVRRASNVEKVNQTPGTAVTAQTQQPVQPVRTLPIVTSTPAVRTLPIVTPSPEISSQVVSPSPSTAATPAIVEEDNEVVRVDTEEVSLNVRVVDGNNRSVNNLEQSQFRVYEDDVLQPVTALGTAEVPVVNALVIDNSRSLRTQLGKIIDAGKIIVSTNRATDESLVVRFVSKDKIEVVQDFTTNKNSLNNALDNLFVEGGQTAIIDAIYRTAKKVDEYQKSQKKEDVKLRSLILVSDGEDRSSSYKEQQLFELLRQSQVQIYAVGFINDLSKEVDASGVSRREKAKSFLTRLAQETGGKVYFPNSIDELPQIANDISGEMRTQYLISYEPTNGSRDGTFRKIKVEIVDGASKEKRIAITRSGRNAAPK